MVRMKIFLARDERTVPETGIFCKNILFCRRALHRILLHSFFEKQAET